jgi:hypothetical protein
MATATPHAAQSERWMHLDVRALRQPTALIFNPHAGQQARVLREPWVRVSKRRGRPLPVHVDGNPIGVTPVELQAAPAALRVITGPPDASGILAWEVVGPVGP